MASTMMSKQLKGAPRAALPSRGALKVSAVARPQASTKAQLADAKAVAAVVLGSTMLLQASPAMANEPVVESTVDSVINAVKATGDFVNSGISAAQAGFEVIKQGYDVVAPVAKQGFDAVAPVVIDVTKKTVELTAPAISAAGPAFSDAVKGSGVDVNSISKSVSTATSAATNAASQAAPVVKSITEFLTTTDPVLLGEYALGAVALYYITPVILGSFKGYQGGISAAAALDALVNDGNVVLVDLRLAKEKENSGITDVPGAASGKVIEVEFAALEDKKLRGQLKDAGYIETQTTALQVASLKRISKGTKVLLLDRYGSSAEAVARELAKKGFGKTYVVSGGFEGRGGWVQSKLQIKPFTGSTTAFTSPSFSRTGTIPTIGRKSLPAPKA